MFGIGLPELALIAFVGVCVFGPDKLPDLARQLAGLVRQVKRLADGARDELRDQLGPDYADLELRDLDPREIVRRHVAGALHDETHNETHDEVDEVDDEFDEFDEVDDEIHQRPHPQVHERKAS